MTTKKSFIILFLVLVAIGAYLVFAPSDENIPTDNQNQTENNNNGGTVGLRKPDSQTPAAGICEFGQGNTVTFEIVDGIPNPRCARVLAGQNIAFTNRTDGTVSFAFAGHSFEIVPGSTAVTGTRVEDYLEPGVHVVSMDFYGKSGPEVWVQGPRVFRLNGTVKSTFVSARAIVLDTPSGELSLAVTDDTRIFTAAGVPVSIANFSLTLVPDTQVEVIANMEEATDTGVLLEARIR